MWYSFKKKEELCVCVSPAGQVSVFKGVERRREEVRGAEEVAEDESTAVELPVDQVQTLFLFILDSSGYYFFCHDLDSEAYLSVIY